MKFWIKLVLRFAIYSNLAIFLVFVGPSWYKSIGNATYPRSYIADVDTPYYTNDYTIFVLEKFNELGDRKIISFEKRLDGRPIFIEQMPTDFVYGIMLAGYSGISYPTLYSCRIYLRKGMTYAMYREVLIHEYLHCMGYPHVNDETDIMYPFTNDLYKEFSIIKYAKELKKRIYGY